MSKKSEKSGTESKTCTRPHAISFDPALKRTRPSFKDECNPTNIVNKFAETGIVTHRAKGEPRYEEAPDMNFFESAVIEAEAASKLEQQRQAPSEAPEGEEAVTASEDQNDEKALPDDEEGASEEENPASAESA